MRLETLKTTAGRVAAGTAAAGLLAFGAVTLTATAAGADTVLQLNSSATAAPGTDCPDDGMAYWHFVVTPNNGKITFEEINLNLGDAKTYDVTGDDIIPNGDQLDNVFVAVPEGKTLTSLQKAGTQATVSGGVTENSKFNLSHVCTGETPTTPTTPTTPSTPTTASATTASVEGASTVPQAAAAAEVQGVEQLPYTGSNTTPLAITGAAVLAGGAALAYAARRRQDA